MDNYIKVAQAIIKEARRHSIISDGILKTAQDKKPGQQSPNILKDISPTNDTLVYTPEFKEEMNAQLRHCFREPGSYEAHIERERKWHPESYETLKQRGVEAGIYPTPKPPAAEEATFMKKFFDLGNWILNLGKTYEPQVKDPDSRNQRMRTREY